MNRRKFLAFLAAGGVVTAAGLWMPGQKLISIPKRASTLEEFTITGNFPKAIWPGVERWFYDKYTDEIVRQKIPVHVFFK